MIHSQQPEHCLSQTPEIAGLVLREQGPHPCPRKPSEISQRKMCHAHAQARHHGSGLRAFSQQTFAPKSRGREVLLSPGCGCVPFALVWFLTLSGGSWKDSSIQSVLCDPSLPSRLKAV